jgi:hypothetical protein
MDPAVSHIESDESYPPCEAREAAARGRDGSKTWGKPSWEQREE